MEYVSLYNESRIDRQTDRQKIIHTASHARTKPTY